VRQIAVVDDETFICAVVAEALADSLGAEVHCATDGAEGAALLASRPFDLALIDAVLPKLSGFAVAAVAAEADIPVLIMTGHPDATEKCEAFGFLWLGKPFPLEVLAREAAKVIADNRELALRTKAAVAKMEAKTKQGEPWA
jgi:DNA-binding response OmpR family regulator